MRGMRAWTIALTWLALTASSAAAQGTYTVESCRADGKPAPLDGWSWEGVGFSMAPSSVSCSDGGGFGLVLDGDPVNSGAMMSWTLLAPADTVLVGVTLSNPRFSEGVGLGYSLDAGGAAIAAHVISDDLVRLRMRSAYFAVTAACGAEICTAPWSLRVSGTTSTFEDEFAPTGTLSPGARTVRFADRGGGVERVELRIDGGAIVEVPVGGAACARPFVTVVPCARNGEVPLSLPADARSVEATLVDAAGNRTALQTASLAVPPVPLAEARRVMRGTVSLTGKRTLRATYDSPPRITGWVRSDGGAAVAGAHVAVTGTRGVVTDAKGRFSVRLPKGPSRTVRFAYGDSVQTVKVIVAAPVRLRTSRTSTRNGRSIRFTGSVPGAGGASTRVELQAWARGRWIPFKTVALKRGTFGASYRFMRTFTKQRYRFRAVIHEDPDFPYAAGRSAEVRVVVRP